LSTDRHDSSGPRQQLLVVLTPEAGVEDDERERLARQLRAELIELDIESLTTVAGRAAPVGSKGADSWGDWLITLSASGGVITSILVAVQEWLSRHRGDHKVRVVLGGDTLELSAATAAEQAEIVRTFLRQHAET